MMKHLHLIAFAAVVFILNACLGLAVVLEQVNTSSTQTLTNKTLTAPTITSPVITGNIVNATLVSPSFSTIENGGTLTLPTGTGFLVGRATSETLTNKTLTAPVFGGSITGTYTLGGTPTITAPAISSPVLSGTTTGTYTLASPILSGTTTGTYTLAGTPTITAPTLTDTTITGSAANGLKITGASTPTLRLNTTHGTNARTQVYFTRSDVTRWILGVDYDNDNTNNLWIYDGLIGTKRLQIEADGSITFYAGQLKFPATANPSADANTLDDYEEGTWTPTLGGTTTYTTQTGTYTKIGRQVFYKGTLVVNAIGSGSTNLVSSSGLPNQGTGHSAVTVSVGVAATSVVSVQAYMPGGGAPQIQFEYRTAAAVSGTIGALFGNGSIIFFSGHYDI